MILAFLTVIFTLPVYVNVNPPNFLSDDIKYDIWITFFLMVLHKIESYGTNEWNFCPLYKYLTKRLEKGKGFFLIFCGTFLVMAFFIMMLIHDPNYRIYLLLVWCGQLLNEIHHISKSYAFKKYYSGSVTALVMVLYGCFIFFPHYMALWNVKDYNYIGVVVTIISFYIFYKEVEPGERKYSSIFITGASRGIGAEIVQLYAREGCHITICSRNEKKLNEVAAKAKTRGATVTVCVMDIRKNVEKALVDANKQKPLDLVIANACMRGSKKEEAEANILSTVKMIDSAMETLHNGTIVVMSSMAVFQPLPIDSFYVATKTLLYDYSRRMKRINNNRVVTVCPGMCRDKKTITNITYKEGAEYLFNGLNAGYSFIAFPYHHYLLLRFVEPLLNIYNDYMLH